MDPTAAEAWAALLAVLLCNDVRIRPVQLEGDAKNVISAVNPEGTDESGWGQLTEDISFTLRTIVYSTVGDEIHTKREIK